VRWVEVVGWGRISEPFHGEEVETWEKEGGCRFSLVLTAFFSGGKEEGDNL